MALALNTGGDPSESGDPRLDRIMERIGLAAFVLVAVLFIVYLVLRYVTHTW